MTRLLLYSKLQNLINAGTKKMYNNIKTDAPEKKIVHNLQKCIARLNTAISDLAITAFLVIKPLHFLLKNIVNSLITIWPDF